MVHFVVVIIDRERDLGEVLETVHPLAGGIPMWMKLNLAVLIVILFSGVFSSISVFAMDEEWKLVPVPGRWETVFGDHDGFAWLKTYVVLPAAWAGQSLTLHAGRIDDSDETFFNGEKVGGFGEMKVGGRGAFGTDRIYEIPGTLVQAGINLISIRIFDIGGAGGLTVGPVFLEGPSSAISLSGGTWLGREGDNLNWKNWQFPRESLQSTLTVRKYLATQGEGAIAPGGGMLLGGHEKRPQGDQLIWFKSPAYAKWTAGLPVGNGRLGGMVLGGPRNWKLQMNEDGIWAGTPADRVRHGAHQFLGKARELLFDGQVVEAQKLMQKQFMSERWTRSYQTLADLTVHQKGISDALGYRRWLDLDEAEAAEEFTSSGITHRRRVIASRPDDCLAVIFESDRAGSISIDLGLDRETGGQLLEPCRVRGQRGWLRFGGRASHGDQHLGAHFESQVSVLAKGGVLRQEENRIAIQGADAVLMVISADSDPQGEFDTSRLLGIHERFQQSRDPLQTYDSLRTRHVADHSSLMSRVELDLGKSEFKDLPTDERLSRIKSGEDDVDLVTTFFQFGRYLQIASSRPGCLPANLQGLWSHHISAPWNADYHININLQMNYWPVEVANLPECHQPLFDFIDALVVRGRETARELYDAPGWVAHHTSDVHAFTVPIGRTVWGLWPLGGAWLCRHLWEHYQFGGDEKFLRERAWPVLRGASEFFVSYLVEDPLTGKLVSGPSSSPENAYRTPDGQVADVGMGNAMDQQIIWDLFTMTLKSAEVLGIDDKLIHAIQRSREKLSRSVIGSDGRILEWSRPWEEVEPGHRHISHLYALHPGEEWTQQTTPEFIEAARRSIEFRLKHGGGHTGWSRAWLLNFFARLGDGEKVAESIRLQLAKSTLPNLLDDHPPFQIDGNFGATAGIAEALVQSHGDGLRLLPALPASWAEQGTVTGLRTRFGVEVSLSWQKGQLRKVRLNPTRNQKVVVYYGSESFELEFQKGREIVLNSKSGKLDRIPVTEQ